ncbi:MAG: DUF6046 domain-containing protein [Flavobacteriales bacterium]
MADFNLNLLYAATFGYVGVPFSKLSTNDEVMAADAFDPVKDFGSVAPDHGVYGTPIHFPCKLNDYKLPNEPLISLSARKLIVMTPIDGNDGTFKELYSRGDMEVVIQGICVDEENPESYPEDQVRAIRNIIEIAKHVKVANRLTSMWNIEHLAIESYSFPAVPGQIGMQGYELRCLSDREFQLRLRER